MYKAILTQDTIDFIKVFSNTFKDRYSTTYELHSKFKHIAGNEFEVIKLNSDRDIIYKTDENGMKPFDEALKEEVKYPYTLFSAITKKMSENNKAFGIKTDIALNNGTIIQLKNIGDLRIIESHKMNTVAIDLYITEVKVISSNIEGIEAKIGTKFKT